MRTREISRILDCAHHKAAEIAAQEIRHHLRPFNLKRHPLSFDGVDLHVGDVPAYTLLWRRFRVVKALHEAAQYAFALPTEVRARLKDHL
jgi:hypothetical protein